MTNEKEMAGSQEEKPMNPEAVQETPELTDTTKNEATDESSKDNSTVDQPTKEQPIGDQSTSKEDIDESLENNATIDQAISEQSAEDNSSPKDVSTDLDSKEESIEEDTSKTDPPEQVQDESKEQKTESSEEVEKTQVTAQEEPEEEVDYSSLDMVQLTEAIAEISKDDNGYKKGKSIFAIKDCYDTIYQGERSLALEKFEADGGSKDDFQYKLSETSIKFEAYFKILREKRVKNAKEHERQKDQNLILKNALLEKLRVFVDDDENTSSINDMKKLQEEWRNIGPVHNQHNNTLWANYNALMDRYYDHRSIYFELKEMDRKKNLTAKIELCVQAEALDSLEILNDAIKKLNDLHEEYKHLGPVPKSSQEETWQRFKTASDKIYVKRKDFVSHLKEEFAENYKKKMDISARIEACAAFESESISEWNSKTKELLAIQKEWEGIGAMPKDKAKAANKKFWGSFKTFFHNKSAFFKTLDAQREGNMKLKQALVDKAIELQSDEDWNATANKYKALQQEWKEVGPVPGKEREKIYKKFKAACDVFFDNKRGHNKEMESSYDDNLKKKEEVCEALELLIGAEDLQPEQVYQLQDAFNGLGFVPKKVIKSIENRYQKALNEIISQAKDFDEDELNELKSLVKINKIKAGPHGDHKLQRKEHSLKRKIQVLESDISTWGNNLGFFANSKNATDLLKDFEEKIKKAEVNLAELKEELKLITYAEH